MRVLVLADALGADLVRLRHAAAALAGRGHAVSWVGDPPPRTGDDPIEVVRGAAGIARTRAEVVIGGGPHAGRLARAAWLAGAGGLLIGVPGRGVLRPGPVARWFLGSLRCVVLADGPPSEEDGSAGIAGLPTNGWPAGDPADGPDPTHADAEHLERMAEGLRSRRHGPAPRPAAFLDRDGTLVVERGYLSRAEDIELLPAVPSALRGLQAAGFVLIVVSNQSGIGRGLFPRSSVIAAMARLRRELRRHGVELDGVYFCPHHPDDGCDCRKPNPGLLTRAIADHGIDPRRSAMMGDKLLDAATGQRGGGLGILVRTGYGREESERPDVAAFGRPPDHVAADLGAAADWLIARDGEPASAVAPAPPGTRSGRGWTLTPLG